MRKTDDSNTFARPPRAEPEILPPDPGAPWPPPGARNPWAGGPRPLFLRPSPIALLLGAGVMGMVLGVGILLLLGFFLLSVPLVAAIAIGFGIAALLRRPRNGPPLRPL